MATTGCAGWFSSIHHTSYAHAFLQRLHVCHVCALRRPCSRHGLPDTGNIKSVLPCSVRLRTRGRRRGAGTPGSTCMSHCRSHAARPLQTLHVADAHVCHVWFAPTCLHKFAHPRCLHCALFQNLHAVHVSHIAFARAVSVCAPPGEGAPQGPPALRV
jgi:hypothetical protein